MTLSDLQGHSLIASFIKYDCFVQLCVSWKTSTDLEHCVAQAVQQLCFCIQSIAEQTNRKSTVSEHYQILDEPEASTYNRACLTGSVSGEWVTTHETITRLIE